MSGVETIWPGASLAAGAQWSDSTGTALVRPDGGLAPIGIGSSTWAELQAVYPNNGAALLALPANTMHFVSDWNSLFVRNGAGDWWVPVGRSIQLSSFGTTSAAHSVRLTGVTAGQFTLLGAVPTIPANLARAGWTVWLKATMRRTTSVATARFDIRLGTAGTVADDLLAYSNPVATGFQTMAYDVEQVFYSSTVRSQTGMAGLGSDSRIISLSANTDYSTNVNTGADQFLSFHVSSANAGDTFDVMSYRFGVCSD
jgi:hypothetical protein